MLKRQLTDTHFIFLTLALVLLLAVPTFQTLTAVDAQGLLLTEETRDVGAQRLPASIPDDALASNHVNSGLSFFTKHNMKCKGNSKTELKIHGEFIQLQGTNCSKKSAAEIVEIVNKSNGYTASVFEKGLGEYQTDLIQLQNGLNEIAIRYQDESGKAFEEHLAVTNSAL